ncbi:MAG: DUF4965 domain-containing protein [Clostridia bacterium]|nr:DUF4965 domain-containing protein [Clostridia bacterium]
MRLRPPAYPLITIDPNFSIWSASDKLTDTDTVHWTGSPVIISGIAVIDGKEMRVIGKYGNELVPSMKQISADCSTFSTEYVFQDAGVRLILKFTSALIPDDLYHLSRPVSYLEVRRESTDGKKHNVSLRLSVSEQICMNIKGDDDVVTEKISLGKLSSVSMGRKNQQMLVRSGDNLRAEWGYFYLTGEGETFVTVDGEGMNFVGINSELGNKPSLFTFAYDDIKSVEYFHKQLTSYWNKNGENIRDEIVKAHGDYKVVCRRCSEIADRLFIDAVRAGGEKYAEMLELAFRQAVAAHKVAVDENGEILFISKECFSNGCAATVDVSYPSIPLFLLYNPELVKGMMRPIYKFARSEDWKYDFAPHDAGRYPILNGQAYGANIERQMPVEECGNMIIMEATVAIATGDVSFAAEHMDILEKWVKYLIENGKDPENQLCTDDFAGHLAHNCNLSLKAIMGIAGFGIIKGMSGQKREEKKYLTMARSMALDWTKRASNGDGSYRLAFDKPDTFSMKYNIVWDKLFGTGLMPREVLTSELSSNRKHMNMYGLPLDNRKDYTKSDWLVWTATLADDREEFESIIEPMWNAYNSMTSRVPMTDWYSTITGFHHSSFSKSENIEKSFRNRTVIGGLFIKLLEYRGVLNVKKI